MRWRIRLAGFGLDTGSGRNKEELKTLCAVVTTQRYHYNRREMGEGERVNDLLDRVSGRLTYRTLIGAETEIQEDAYG